MKKRDKKPYDRERMQFRIQMVSWFMSLLALIISVVLVTLVASHEMAFMEQMNSLQAQIEKVDKSIDAKVAAAVDNLDIKDGKDGRNGVDGTDGIDGVDGSNAAPIHITGQHQDLVNNYTVVDFSDSSEIVIPNGKNGEDGLVAVPRCNPDYGYMEYSYNNQTWQPMYTNGQLVMCTI